MNLKPCPFCGSEAMLSVDDSDYVMCSNWDCILNSGLSKAFPPEQWNTRHQPNDNELRQALSSIKALIENDAPVPPNTFETPFEQQADSCICEILDLADEALQSTPEWREPEAERLLEDAKTLLHDLLPESTLTSLGRAEMSDWARVHIKDIDAFLQKRTGEKCPEWREPDENTPDDAAVRLQWVGSADTRWHLGIFGDFKELFKKEPEAVRIIVLDQGPPPNGVKV